MVSLVCEEDKRRLLDGGFGRNWLVYERTSRFMEGSTREPEIDPREEQKSKNSVHADDQTPTL